MKIVVEIPGLLIDLSHGKNELLAEGRNIKELLHSLEDQLPGFKERFFDKSGDLSNMVNVFVNEVDFHRLSGLNTPVSGGDRVRLAIAPLISGGCLP